MGCSLAAEDNEQDVFPIQIRLYVMQQTDSLVVKISLMVSLSSLFFRTIITILKFSVVMCSFIVRFAIRPVMFFLHFISLQHFPKTEMP